MKVSKYGHSSASEQPMPVCYHTYEEEIFWFCFMQPEFTLLHYVVIAFYVFDVDHQVKSFLYPPVSQVKTDIRSSLNLFFRLNKFYLYIRCSDPLNILMVFHWLVLVCQCLTHSDNPKILYDVLNYVSKCQRRNKYSFDLLTTLLRLAFSDARVHCWSMHNFCLLRLLCPL